MRLQTRDAIIAMGYQPLTARKRMSIAILFVGGLVGLVGAALPAALGADQSFHNSCPERWFAWAGWGRGVVLLPTTNRRYKC